MQAVESEKRPGEWLLFAHAQCERHLRRLRDLENRHGETEALLARPEYQEEQRPGVYRV